METIAAMCTRTLRSTGAVSTHLVCEAEVDDVAFHPQGLRHESQRCPPSHLQLWQPRVEPQRDALAWARAPESFSRTPNSIYHHHRHGLSMGFWRILLTVIVRFVLVLSPYGLLLRTESEGEQLKNLTTTTVKKQLDRQISGVGGWCIVLGVRKGGVY